MRWMHQYVANKNVFRNRLKLFPPIMGFCKLSGSEFQTDGPATQTVGRRSWAGGSVLRLEAVGWRIRDVAVMRHLRLVGTIPRGTEALDREGSWTPWRRACTLLAEEHPANVARYGRVVISLGWTCGYCWHTGCGIQHSLWFVGRCFWCTRQDCIAVVNVRRDERMYECGRWLHVEWTLTLWHRHHTDVVCFVWL